MALADGSQYLYSTISSFFSIRKTRKQKEKKKKKKANLFRRHVVTRLVCTKRLHFTVLFKMKKRGKGKTILFPWP